jgi:diketogulonate reductase-like aldo/keto reductase
MSRWAGRATVLLMLLALSMAPEFIQATIPTHPLAGGGEMPMLMMGGNDFAGWFAAAGKGAGIQTFHGYGNGPHIAPQLQKAGRHNVFVSTGIPCGCCGSDAPAVQPMNTSLAKGYIDDELSQLNTSYVDLLLFHHRCRTPEETVLVWRALEDAKRAGRARHIGVSNFNAHDLQLLVTHAEEPVEVVEAHFGTALPCPLPCSPAHPQGVCCCRSAGVGIMDFEVLEFTRAHNIHPVSFSSLSEASTDLAALHPAVAQVAAAHGNVSSAQVMYAYVHSKNITVLSTYGARGPMCPPFPPPSVHPQLVFLLSNIRVRTGCRRPLSPLVAGGGPCDLRY